MRLTCWIWILPSSRRPGLLYLTIHVRYVRGQTMLIKCCFAIIVMVDTIFSASNQSSLKFLPAFGTIHHVLLQHLDFYSDHATLDFYSDMGGDTWEFHLNLLLCIMCVCVCASLFGWLVSTFDWFLLFLFSRFSYGFTPLRHCMSRHYTSRQRCPKCIVHKWWGVRV
jgi:hypothetical protein